MSQEIATEKKPDLLDLVEALAKRVHRMADVIRELQSEKATSTGNIQSLHADVDSVFEELGINLEDEIHDELHGADQATESQEIAQESATETVNLPEEDPAVDAMDYRQGFVHN